MSFYIFGYLFNIRIYIHNINRAFKRWSFPSSRYQTCPLAPS